MGPTDASASRAVRTALDPHEVVRNVSDFARS